jgi:hypothetical protein
MAIQRKQSSENVKAIQAANCQLTNQYDLTQLKFCSPYADHSLILDQYGVFLG